LWCYFPGYPELSLATLYQVLLVGCKGHLICYNSTNLSLQFNDTTTYRGIVQQYEDECGYNRGDVSGNTELLKSFTANCNLALDDFFSIAIQASGSWGLDDSNHTKYAVMQFNLVSGQRDYSFTTDEQSNLILDIYRVLVATPGGVFYDIDPVDQQQADNNNSKTISFLDGQNLTGTPTRYDKTANGFFLDPIPNYNYTNGVKVLYNREASYFAYTDTTKKPGVPGLLHRYFAIKPAMDYARRNNKSNYVALVNEVTKLELMIVDNFASRQKDVTSRMNPNVESTR
jgi:hypothetical protein